MNAPALDVSQTLRRGEFRLDARLAFENAGAMGLYGPSGCGKTTLLRCIAGLEPMVRGHVRIANTDWQTSAGQALPAHRRRVGYVFQDARLFPHLNVAGNLRFALRAARGNRPALFSETVDRFNLSGLLKRRPGTLSGGEQRRVALARALLRQPDLLLLDEPLTGLDATQKLEVLPYLDRLRAERLLPMLMVSHHIDEIIRVCDQLVRMDAGQVVASGPLDAVLLRHDLPMLAGDEASSMLRGVVKGFDERYGMTRVDCDFQTLLLPGHQGTLGETLRLRILARDVSLCLSQPRDTSIQNILPVTIEGLSAAGPAEVDIALQLGEQRLLARVTARAQDKLKLVPGQKLFAQIKGVAVRRSEA
ncbi:MAG: molybdenum ABC transporter ATP-binding protein [Salinisphaeraceae bacterium]|nr:molybdenum ABC transporter ATP-binding protein [Salinisphaeraceae bacterium]